MCPVIQQSKVRAVFRNRQYTLTLAQASRYIDDMNEQPTASQTLEAEFRAAIDSNPLDALVGITSVRTVVADLEREAVRRSVETHSWAEIGAALGVSKQAAFQRFGKQWVREARAEMKAAGGADAKRAFGEKVRRSLKSLK